jgi:molecular chaperone GrpE
MRRHRNAPSPAAGPGAGQPPDAAGAVSIPASASGGSTPDVEDTAENGPSGSGRESSGPASDRSGPTLESPLDAETRVADYLDQLQRLKAEFDNYRRRTAKEREVWFVQAQAELAEALLPVLDDLRRAREHEAAGEMAESEGWRLIHKRFEDTLERLGLETQEVEPGREFDPEQHDAVLAQPSADVPEGAIIRVLEPGYLFRGRLLRRSRISYSTGPAGE